MGGRILLTGVTGQVGGELLKSLTLLGEVVAPTRAEMDLTKAASVRETILSVRPRWIINPGAYTAVDKAEDEPELAYAINAEAVRVIGLEARAIGAGVIHFSTDYVFDGSGNAPYCENDIARPVSVYGSSKLAGERALMESCAGHIIFRTSWVYGARGKNFLLTILKLARERETLRVVADQYGAPTWSRDLAKMTAQVVHQCETEARGCELSALLGRVGGVYHATGAGETSWHGFATEAVQLQQQAEPHTRFAKIEAITTAEYPTPAKRPRNSRMNCGRLRERFGWTMLDWQASLREVLSEV
jgi:dTDP-4-dehydrorhamnose reductase